MANDFLLNLSSLYYMAWLLLRLAALCVADHTIHKASEGLLFSAFYFIYIQLIAQRS